MRGRAAGGIGSVVGIGLVVAAAQVHARRPAQTAFAEPGDIVAAEGDFTHLSVAKGVRAAIRATAAADAEIFAPRLLRVAAYPAPDALPPWHTRQLWMSCDGSIAVTYGQWQQGPATGWYSAIWQRRKGGYRWVLAQGGTLAAPLPESDMIAASVADCPPRRARGDGAPAPASAPAGNRAPPVDYTTGHADDRTLEWATAAAGDDSRTFTVAIKQDGSLHEVLRATAPPGG